MLKRVVLTLRRASCKLYSDWFKGKPTASKNSDFLHRL